MSEALIATAAGLFVAIPAALFYNYFTGTINQAMPPRWSASRSTS
ncbi:MAG: MotA/TolQ/ExbB proton channel family protein [Desulfomonilia bacterium]